ncbi:hypothetical protein [Erythrobacter sp. YT30]|uniref:hypothetical protein n=1 Tax=Erythrobacter sp. YT30 TaxID=1735012 RepID=UPI00076C419F|nr:hypothetical protein [Erythrobacter sp. YT30]KWV90357.1 hypothetical protein AUC45_13855 [Erythrobacter sp. YT30]
MQQFIRVSTRALAAATLLAGTALSAQEPTDLPADGEVCELHVWAAEDFLTIAFGDGLGGMLYTALQSFDGTEEAGFKDIASATFQLEAIVESDPIDKLGLPENTKIITHTETEERKVSKKRKERRTDSTAQCYFELHTWRHYLVEDIVWGDRFTTEFDLRSYSNSAEWDFRYRTSGGNKLTVFPIKPEDDLKEVASEVRTAIAGNFDEYAEKAKRRIAKKLR